MKCELCGLEIEEKLEKFINVPGVTRHADQGVCIARLRDAYNEAISEVDECHVDWRKAGRG